MKQTNCPLQQTLREIGGKWKLVIIWHLIDEPKRFNELKRLVGSISTKVLADQLNQMIKLGLVTRHPLPTNPIQVNYMITEKGKSLEPLISEIYSWGEVNLS